MEEILSVTGLTAAIKNQLEGRFPSIQVKGEISNLKPQASGHLYFTLKDQESQIPAVLFRGNAQDLKQPPQNGDQVIAQGALNVYGPRGYYQIVVRKLTHSGVGELLLQLHNLKNKLDQMGWFDPKHKKPLPRFPKTIGVVTSPTGSVIQDILNILSRRFSNFHLILNPVKVQGEGASLEIARAIEEFNRFKLADVLIVGRGGGSLEDLWAFNQECVAQAIFASQIPVISAVGHETDVSICDFVADLRAPTPSAAAEIVTAEAVQRLKFLSDAKVQMRKTLLGQLQHYRMKLNHLQRYPVFCNPLSLIEPHQQRIDDWHSDLTSSVKRNLQEKHLQLRTLTNLALGLKPQNQILTLKEKLRSAMSSADRAIRQQILERKKSFESLGVGDKFLQGAYALIREKKQRLAQLTSHLQGIDPKNLLSKGYCILFREKTDSVILSVSELKKSDGVRLKLHDGTARLTVEDIAQ